MAAPERIVIAGTPFPGLNAAESLIREGGSVEDAMLKADELNA